MPFWRGIVCSLEAGIYSDSGILVTRPHGRPGNEEVSGEVAMIFRFGGLTTSEEAYEWTAFDSFVVMSWIEGRMAGVDCMISPDEPGDTEPPGAFLVLDSHFSTRDVSVMT